MRRNILIFGVIAGLINFTIFVTMGDQPPLEYGMLIGYATMLVALSAVFVGIKRYRDIELGGVIRFWPAFGMAVAMSFIAGVFYVTAWEASQAISGADFMTVCSNCLVDQARAKGASAEAIAQMTAEMAQFKVLYANPWWRLPMVFTEIFPVGVLVSLVSLVSAALLRKPTLPSARR